MQRLSSLSGTLANRPTPETVNATWGGTGYGILYWSTDTGQVFQWNGSAWVDLTSVFIPAAGTQIRRFTDTTQYVYNTVSSNLTTGVTIPAALLVSGSQIEIDTVFQLNSGTSVTYGAVVNGSSTVSKGIASGGTNLNYRTIHHFVVGATEGSGEMFVNGTTGIYDNVNNQTWPTLIANPFTAGAGATIQNRYNITAIITQMIQYYQSVRIFV
jgi:hypothetical protein